MAVFVDVGHGPNNAKQGVNDPGASAQGTTEAAEVRKVADALMPLLLARGVDARRAPDGNIATVRIPWQKKTLTKADTFVSLHCNSASATATGCSVFYAANAPHLHDDAERMSAKLSEVLGIEDDGAKPDTSTAVGYVGVLHASDASAMLIEMGFIGNAFDLEAIRTKGAQAVCEAILTILAIPPTFRPSEEQRAAFALMLQIGYYLEGTPKSQERYEHAVLTRRLLDILDQRYVRR